MNAFPYLIWAWVPLLCFWLVAIGFSVRLSRRFSRREELVALLFDIVSFVLLIVLMSLPLLVKIVACIVWLLAGYLCTPLLHRLSPYEKAAILALDSSLALAMGVLFQMLGVTDQIGLVWSLVLLALSSAAVIFFWLAYCRDRGIR